MKILGIDTTTKFLSLGFYADGKVYEYNLEAGSRLSGLLVPTIERALAALGWDIASIDYFACGIGPGSFTGVRVGLATVKGFAYLNGATYVMQPEAVIWGSAINSVDQVGDWDPLNFISAQADPDATRYNQIY